MRELDCDFCGAQAAGAYEVGPEPPDRSPTQRRRLVLCENCRVTLTDAIEPLRERLAAAESDGDDSATDTESSTATATDTESSAATTSDTTDATASTSTDPLSGPDSTARNGASPSGGETEADDDTTADSTVAADAGGSSNATDEDETTADSDTGTDTTAGSDDGSAGGDQSDSSSSHSEEPPEFRRVMRLLNNRTFPVDRTEFTELATGAYDLDEREVDRIVEYAVERGVLAVESGQLTRG